MNFARNQRTCMIGTLFARELLKRLRLLAIEILTINDVNGLLSEIRVVFEPSKHPVLIVKEFHRTKRFEREKSASSIGRLQELATAASPNYSSTERKEIVLKQSRDDMSQ